MMMLSSELDNKKYYLKFFDKNNKELLNSYKFYGKLDLIEIDNVEFLGELKVISTKRGTSKSTIVVEVLGHPFGQVFKSEIGLGSIKDILFYCSCENGIIKGVFKFGKRGNNYFIVPVKK